MLARWEKVRKTSNREIQDGRRRKLRIFKIAIKPLIVVQKSSVTYVGICIWSQGINFLYHFYDLTHKIQNGRQNDLFSGRIRPKFDIFNVFIPPN